MSQDTDTDSHSRPDADWFDCHTLVENLDIYGARVRPGRFDHLWPWDLGAKTVVEDLAMNERWKEPEGVTAAKVAGLVPS